MRQPLRIMSTTASALIQCVTRSHSGWMVVDAVGRAGAWMFKFVSLMHAEYVFHAAWSDELAVSYKEFEKSENCRRTGARHRTNNRRKKIIVSEL